MLPSGGSTWWAATSGAPPRSTAGLWWLTRAPPFSSARWARTEFAGRPATSIHVPAAVNVQRLAGDVTVARQHQGGIGHFVARTETADGNAIGRRFHIGRDHFGFDQGGRNRIHRDAFPGEARRVEVRQPEHARLRRRVVRAHYTADVRGHRGEVDDAAPRSE